MKKYLYPIFVIVPMLVIFSSCEEPKPEAWLWNADDSLAIMELVEPQKGFLSSKDFIPSSAISISFPAELIEQIKSDTSYNRYLVKEFSFSLTDSVFAYKFESAVDTTVTGYVYDTLKGQITLSVDSFFAQGSELPEALDTSFTKALRYSSRNAIFFDSLGGDSKWRIAKYSGGCDGQSPDVSASPVLDSLKLDFGSKNLTVIFPADTILYGIRGLHEPSKFVSISSGQSISIAGVYPKETDTIVLYVKGEGGWIPYTDGISLAFSKKGLQRIYVIGISLKSILTATGEWSSVIWGLPIVVN
ncbi:hypothetical protein GX441_05075 [bacterium]|nr:hypothetical protein [bacterium]